MSFTITDHEIDDAFERRLREMEREGCLLPRILSLEIDSDRVTFREMDGVTGEYEVWSLPSMVFRGALAWGAVREVNC